MILIKINITGTTVITILKPFIVDADWTALGTYPVVARINPVNKPPKAVDILTYNVCIENTTLSFLGPSLYSP